MNELAPTLAQLSKRDLAHFAQMPAAVRNEAMRWHQMFLQLEEQVQAGLKTQEAALHDMAAIVERPFKTVRRIFFAKWRAGGRKWSACVNRTKARDRREESVTHSPVFVDWWVHHAGSFQRNTKAAHRAFVSRWKAGERIPGLDPNLSRNVTPAGCSYENLCAVLRKHELAMVAQRRGFATARSYGPMVLTTRVGLWPGSHVVIDDMRHDNFVLFQGQIVRVDQLAALDMFSGHLCAWGAKPRYRRDDGTEDALKEKQARLLVVDYLARHGYSPRGTHFLAEHGTAAICEALETKLHEWSGGRIAVRRSGITGHEQALLGLGHGEGKGNFRFKTWLESWHNLLHNELAALPAQTGLSVDRRPEFTAGQLKMDSDLARAALWLAKREPQLARLLQSRTLHYHGHFLPLLGAVIDAINRRGEDPDIWTHDLEGWVKCGHVVNEFRLHAYSGEWLTDAALLDLPAELREATLALAQQRRGLMRTRHLSPREVWTPGRRELVRMPDFVIAEMLGDDFGRELKVDKMAFCFQDAELDPEPLQYESRVTGADGIEEELPSNETFWLTFNPFNLAKAYVWDAKRRFLGTVKRDARISRMDQQSVEDRFKRVATRSADVLAGVRRAHVGELREETRRLADNTDLLAAQLKSEGIQTPGELRAAKREQERPAVADDCTADTLARASATEFSPADWGD